MGNYNTKCSEEDCKTKTRKLEKDVFHCKYHRCVKVLCNLERSEKSRWCEHHV